MKHPLSSFSILSLALVAALSLRAAAPFAAMPYTYVGRVLDWEGHTQGDGEGITIRAYTTSGRLLAKTGTFASGATPYNYRLSIPVASTRVDGCVVTGDKVVFEVEVGGGESEGVYRSVLPTGKDVIGAAGGLCRADLTLATDSDQDGVPDEYLDQLFGYMSEMGLYYQWDPNADWDGDGMSNLAEYRMGTNPFMKDDYFRVKAAEALAEMDENCFFAMSFFAVSGHTYGVRNTSTLGADAKWIYAPFRLEASGEADERYFYTDVSENGSTATLYVPKYEAKSGFYRVTVE